jgi:hypothetical protein
MEGVTASRIEAHRLRQMLNRGLNILNALPEEDRGPIYQRIGDLVLSIPKRLDYLEVFLDRTSYALTLMGEDFLRGRIPMSEKTMVQETVKSTPTFTPLMRKAATRLAHRYLNDSEE